jgi:hypothetical protein
MYTAPTESQTLPPDWWPDEQLARTLVEETEIRTIPPDPPHQLHKLLGRAAQGIAAADRRRRLTLLSGWALLWLVILAVHGGYSWHYFTQGSALLFSGASAGAPAGGLHLYANYPQLQIGPFTFAIADLLQRIGPSHGLYAAEAVMSALGVLVLYCLERIAQVVRPDLEHTGRYRATMLIGGAVFLVGWVDLAAGYAHLDDVLALVCATLAVWAAVEELPAIAGICVGLAVDSKPWALVFLPLILTAPKHGRRPAAVCTAAVILLAWLPFITGDWHTLTAAGYTITNEPSSALRALGVTSAGTPSWDRAAQIVLGCTLGAIAVRRQRWAAVILLGVGARIALDPGVYAYYTAGVLLGALIWDLLGTRRPLPLWTLTSAAALSIAPMLTSDAALLGQIRLGLVAAFTLAVLLTPVGTEPHARSRSNATSTKTARGLGIPTKEGRA